MVAFPLKPRPAGTLKEAFAHLVCLCGGFTVAARADGVRVGKTSLFKYSDADDAENRDHFAPLDVIAALESCCGRPVVGLHLLARLGWVAMPAPAAVGGASLAAGMAAIGAETSALFRDYGAALADDGVVSAAEAGRLLADTDRAVAVLMAARSRLVEKLEEERERCSSTPDR